MRRILQTGLTFVATLVSLLLTPAFAQAQQRFGF